MDSPYPSTETIAAIATAPGRGGIGIVRVSGPDALRIATLITGTTPQARRATLSSFNDETGAPLDTGITLFFPGPASFTGDDVIEFQGHGGPVVLDMLLERVLSSGARIARPGEFSQRAFLNGKIDLAQAEAIADLIDSASREAARGAMRSLQGEFSEKVDTLIAELTRLRVIVEACIDFPEEDVDILADTDVRERIDALILTIRETERAARSGRLLRDGMSVLIAGKPNAGKSSLLNALANDSIAIVSTIPGTTRDLIRERIEIDGMPVHITDTAGLRESPDEIEREGMRRALREAEHTDVLLLVVDSTREEDPRKTIDDHFSHLLDTLPPLCIVLNKCDLSGIASGVQNGTSDRRVAVSALTGEGIDALRQSLCELAGFAPSGGGSFTARRRHLDALRRARESLDAARNNLLSRVGTELVAEELRIGQQSLGEITGHLSPDELLGKIFTTFCIGK